MPEYEVIRESAGRGYFGKVNLVALREGIPEIANNAYQDVYYAEKVAIDQSKTKFDLEASRWNDYFYRNNMTEYACALTSENSLDHPSEVGNVYMYTPWLGDEEPTKKEVQGALIALFDQGYYMADPKPNNFRKLANGCVVPIDFGELYHKDDLTISVMSKNLIKEALMSTKYAFYFSTGHIENEGIKSKVAEMRDAYNTFSSLSDQEEADLLEQLEEAHSPKSWVTSSSPPPIMLNFDGALIFKNRKNKNGSFPFLVG